MREIKFRAWEYRITNFREYRKNNTKPIYGFQMNYEPSIYDGECLGEYSQVRLNKAFEMNGDASVEEPQKDISFFSFFCLF